MESLKKEIAELEMQIHEARKTMAKSDAHLIKWQKKKLDFKTTYPEEFKEYEETNRRYSELEKKVINLEIELKKRENEIKKPKVENER